MSDIRDCEQCGTTFTPRREHARFCSARCRVAWNRADRANPSPGTSALAWAVTAMIEATERLPRITGLDRRRAFAVISEAVWWVTIVDANLVRYYPETYDNDLAGRDNASRAQVEETLAGFRFVRNQIGHDIDRADFIRATPSGGGTPHSRDWTWATVPEPGGASMSPRGLAWELTRYQAYQSRLAGRPVVTTFRCAASFLKIVASGITPAEEVRALD
ncbi:MAG TPA: hypothetical protein VMA32_03665 [Streptosporangiaceae bacterium]|nr:hypothetical protein [Streptosporangiaceae bacterium]